MPVAESVDLQKFVDFAKPLVENGDYSNANDVLTAAMDALTREKVERQKTATLTEAIEAGFASGVAEGDVFGRVRAMAGLRPRSAH